MTTDARGKPIAKDINELMSTLYDGYEEYQLDFIDIEAYCKAA